jgi:polysaccharide biosynthesis protein PslH
MRKRRILMLCPFAPRRDALHGGNQLIGRLVEELSEGNLVRVLCLRSEHEPAAEEELARRCDSIEEIRRPGAGRGFRRTWNVLSAFWTGQPLWVQEWSSGVFRKRVRDTILSWRPDVIHFEAHIMAQYLDEALGKPSILMMHEPGTAAALDRWRSSRGWRRVALRREAIAWERYERAILGRFGTVVCLTDRDRRELAALAPSARFTVIPPRSHLRAVPRVKRQESSPPTVVFVGNFIHPPNVDAAMRLARDIFPGILLRHPQAILQIVGDGPPRSIVALRSDRIVVTGRVPDVAPYLSAATVVAIPVRTGGGIRMKTIASLSAGAAVVATPLAAEGLNVVDGHDLLLADSDQEIVDALSALLADPDRRELLGKNALEWARGFSKRGNMREGFESLYDELACSKVDSRLQRSLRGAVSGEKQLPQKAPPVPADSPDYQ